MALQLQQSMKNGKKKKTRSSNAAELSKLSSPLLGNGDCCSNKVNGENESNEQPTRKLSSDNNVKLDNGVGDVNPTINKQVGGADDVCPLNGEFLSLSADRCDEVDSVSQSISETPNITPAVDNILVAVNNSKAVQKITSEEKQSTEAVQTPSCLLKVHRDLQRQVASLTRLQLLSISRTSCAKASIHTAFDKLRSVLNDRESQLIANLDEVHASIISTLSERLSMARSLKLLINDSVDKSTAEQEGLRNHIKKFVSERSVDQTIGSGDRFTCCIDDLIQHIETFGSVNTFQSTYTYTLSDVPTAITQCLKPFMSIDNPVPCRTDVDTVFANLNMLANEHQDLRTSQTTQNVHSNTSTEQAVCVISSHNEETCFEQQKQQNDDCNVYSTLPISFGARIDSSVSQHNSTSIENISSNSRENMDISDVSSIASSCSFDIDGIHSAQEMQSVKDFTSEISHITENLANLSSTVGMTTLVDNNNVVSTLYDTEQISNNIDTLQAGGRGLIRLSSVYNSIGPVVYRSDYHTVNHRGGRGGRASGRRHSGPSSYNNSNYHETPQQHRYNMSDRDHTVTSFHDNKPHPKMSQSRRTTSYSDNKVDEDGFTLVTHNVRQHDGFGRGRVRGSSGDSKYYYGSEVTHGNTRSGHKLTRGFFNGNAVNNNMKRWN